MKNNLLMLLLVKVARIAIIASDEIKNPEVNYVIMANCGDWYGTSKSLNKLA